MKKLLIGVIATVMVSGLFLGSIGTDVFALSEKGAEKGQAKGCVKGEAKNNPHCDIEQCDSTQMYYFDGDHDTFGAGAGFTCDQIDNFNTNDWVTNNDDCDDSNPTVGIC